MKLLKTLFENFGYVSAEQLAEIAQVFPATRFVVQWGAAPRVSHRADEIPAVIKKGEAKGDYVRSVWMTADDLDKLQSIFKS